MRKLKKGYNICPSIFGQFAGGRFNSQEASAKSPRQTQAANIHKIQLHGKINIVQNAENKFESSLQTETVKNRVSNLINDT